jgi:hypothetical protein
MRDSSRPLFLSLSAAAALGLALSILSHVATFFGMRGPVGDYAWLLHLGVFVVWLPTVLVSRRLTIGFARKDVWKASLRGCPPWMRHAVCGFFSYAMLNFILFMATVPPHGSSLPMTPSVLRGFSGHWMAFYSAASAVLYSAAHVNGQE